MEFPSLSLELQSDIPAQGGLGSSAAATVAGLLLYERLAGPREGRDLLTVATRLDEHADNVGAAMLGGLVTTCVRDDGTVIARAVPWPEGIRFVVASPAVRLATSESRRVLPPALPLADAVFNLQRALLPQALEHGTSAPRARGLARQMAPAVPGAARARVRRAPELRHPDLLGVCLSGSGPSVLALCSGSDETIAGHMREVHERLQVPCAAWTLSAHQPGMCS